jgi:polyadenylate-binding protein
MTSQQQAGHAQPDAQVYVGDLNPTVAEIELYHVFENCGKIVYIQIFRKMGTGESRGFAFIHFETPENARAARSLNGTLVAGKPIRVAINSRKREPEANLFVKNLSATCTTTKLDGLFQSFGDIISSKISYDERGHSCGYGFVQFASLEQADQALKAMQGHVFEGQELYVSKFLRREDRGGSHVLNNLYVRGFGQSFTEAKLKERFSEFGEVKSLVVIHKEDAGSVRSFGMVCYEAEESAKTAINALHGKAEDDFEWFVVPHMSRSERRRNLMVQHKTRQEEWKKRNLFISNLDVLIDETKLQNLFGDYGPIESVKILKNENIRINATDAPVRERLSTGVAFVCFVRGEDAERAQRDMNKKIVENKKLYVAKWLPKEELLQRKHYINMRRFYAAPMAHPYFMHQPYGHPQMPPPAQAPFRQPNRNPGPRVPRAVPRQAAPQAAAPPVQVARPPIDMDKFNKSPPAEQKRLLGEALYSRIVKLTNTNLAGKITGMLLEMESEEVISLLTDEKELKEKTREAFAVLREAWKSNPQGLALLQSISL